MNHKLPELPYEYNSLEPYIDAKTMEIHYTKHHQAYVDNLNLAIEGDKELEAMSVEELLLAFDSMSEARKDKVRNNGGGHYNHSFFWEIMGMGEQDEPSGEFGTLIDESFGSLDEFKEEFKAQALSRFGSGWVWLVMNETCELDIITTPNQDNPITEGVRPILGLDLWEHAYYLKYQNKRGEYVENWWNVVNWEQVDKNFDKALNFYNIKTCP